MIDIHNADERNEYVIEAKLKNNLILSRVLEHSKTVHQFCMEHDLSPTQVGNLINMKLSPTNKKDGDWTLPAIRLASALCVHPEALFFDEQRTLELKTNVAFIELSRQEAIAFSSGTERLEAAQVANSLLGNLRPRERMVLSLRYLEDKTLEDVASSFDLTRERIRQIEMGALRKLRRISQFEDESRVKRIEEARIASGFAATHINVPVKSKRKTKAQLLAAELLIADTSYLKETT